MSFVPRKIAAAVLTVTALVGLAACASPSASSDDGAGCEPSDGKVTLSYWSWLPGIDRAVDAFNESHPDIHVELSNITQAEAYQSYFNALKANKAPDLAMIQYAVLPTFKASDYLQDISACEPVADLADKLVPWTYEQVSLGTDAVYATPTDIGPLALYYRRDIFEKYGLGEPATWDEYRAAAEKLKAADPAVSITSFTPQDFSALLGMAWQAGAKPFTYTSDSFVIDMNSEPMDRVADYWQRMIDDGLVDTSIQPLSPAQYAAWNDGTIASTIGASWLSSLIENNAASASGKWGVLPLPNWTKGEVAGGNNGGASTAVLAGTKHPYEAAVFADWLSTNLDAINIVFSVGGTSAALAWGESGAYDVKYPFYGDQAIFKVFEASAEATDTSFQWAPNQINVNNYLQDALTGAFDGSSTIKDAFAETQTEAVADLKSQSIPVQEK